MTGPDRTLRRAKGKDDELDAIVAAQAALIGQRVQVAKDRSGAVEALRVLRTCASWRPDILAYRDPVAATRIALKSLARRVLDLNDEVADLDRFIEPLVKEHGSALTQLEGVGTDSAGQLLVAAGENPDSLRSEASFAILCGACPIPASSGKTQRHRLNRRGNWQANSALHVVVLSRMRIDPRTKKYVQRRLDEGRTKRCLKRYVAREINHVLIAA